MQLLTSSTFSFFCFNAKVKVVRALCLGVLARTFHAKEINVGIDEKKKKEKEILKKESKMCETKNKHEPGGLALLASAVRASSTTTRERKSRTRFIVSLTSSTGQRPSCR